MKRLLAVIFLTGVDAKAIDETRTCILIQQQPATNSLAERCQLMLKMQRVVHEDTRNLFKAMNSNADKEATSSDKKIAANLSKKQKGIIKEATAAIKMLQANGAAIAFSEVLDGLRQDMRDVQNRLRRGETGQTTQAMQGEIIDTLEEMIKALTPRPPATTTAESAQGRLRVCQTSAVVTPLFMGNRGMVVCLIVPVWTRLKQRP